MLQVCEGKHVHSGVNICVKMEKQDDAHRPLLVLSSFTGRILLPKAIDLGKLADIRLLSLTPWVPLVEAQRSSPAP